MYDDKYFEHDNHFLQTQMKKYKKYIHKTLPNSNEIKKMFEQKLTLN